MSLNLKCAALGVALSSCLIGLGWLSADETKEKNPPSETSSGLVAPEFAEHLDVDAASAALRDGDDVALLAIGEKLGAAERAAGKPNTLPAFVLFQGAIRAAQFRRDVKALGEIEKAVKSTMALKPVEKTALVKMIEFARKFASAPRKIDAGPGLKPNEVSAESVSLYNTFTGEIRTTQEYGTEEDLDPLADGIKQLNEFHPKQREHLMKLLGEARSVIKERGEADPALAKLAAASRQTSGYHKNLRIAGPDVVVPGPSYYLAMMPGRSGAFDVPPKQLYVRAGSPNVKLIASDGKLVSELIIPWEKISRTVGVRVTGLGPPAVVNFGGTQKADAVRWSATVKKQ